MFDVTFDLGCTLYRRFFGQPDLLEVRVLALDHRDLFIELGHLFLCRRRLLFFHRLALNLQLNQAALEAIHGLGLGVNFHSDPTACLIDQVDGFVRQLPVSDVTLTQFGRSDNGAVSNIDAVMHLVALFEATQNGDGVLLAGLVHQHLLETSLQRGVSFHILAIFVQGGRADTVQLTAGQGRFEHVARIHRALGLARPDHGVELIDKQDDAPLFF